ncbi:PREDICTED: putative gustatory receptor 28b isoform X1 [Vollenhovia emeryi]|uniref:putative gustatory receptor 28b isoform X1 n=1 Tax=Vollenhovia emeryi TaxID=411798 RepID=UPI0005F3C5D5|nr:PREDICTED: putative gustatory receptor 28b isoform X1 [Vollenhovia emeryi]
MDPTKKQLLVYTSQSFEKVSRFLGINLSSYIGRLYSLALVAFLIFLSHIAWQTICTAHCENGFLIKVMLAARYSLMILLLLIMVSTSVFRPKQFSFPRQEMFMVDSLLESYGARFTDRDIFFAKHLQDIAVAIIILLDVAENIFNIIADYSFQMICTCFFNWYTRTYVTMIDGLFSHHMNDIYLRFRELNKITIQHSRENLSVSYIDFTASSNLFNKRSNAVVTKIRSIQHIHHGLYILATKINTNFGLPLLIMSVISLTSTIFLLYDIRRHLQEDENNIKTLISHVHLIFFHTLRFLYISYICQRSRNEFKQMAIILHDAFLEYKSLRAEVIHFSLQLVHDNLTFTALGLYVIDIPLICSIAGATITYLIMVIQLDTKLSIELNEYDNVTTYT